MSALKIAATDPTLARAAFKATFKTAPAQARAADEILTLLHKWNGGQDGATRKDLRDEVSNRHQEMERRLVEGRAPFPYDVSDDLTYGLFVLDTIGTAAPYIATGVGAETGTVAGMLARTGLKDFTSVAKDFVALPLLKDLIRDARARSGADASAELTDRMGSSLDPAVNLLTDAIKNDPTGTLVQAAKDLGLMPEQVTDGDLSPGALVRSCPDVFPTDITINIQEDNSIVIEDIDAFRVAVTNQFAALTSQVTDGFSVVEDQLKIINQTQQEIGNGQNAILDMLLKQQATQEQKDQIEAARKTAADTMAAGWAAMVGGVTGLAAIASLFDKKLAADITRVGGAAVQTAQCVVAFSDAISALSKGLTALSAFGSAAATGNLIGAVVGLIGLFGEQGPSPEEQILQGIADLQKGLDSLHKEMSESFSRIDEKLNEIYKDVMGALHEIATTVNLTYDVALDIQRRIVRQEIALARLSQSMASFFKAVERADLWQQIDASLDYATRSATPMTAEQFNAYTSEFHTWATILAFDNTNQPLAGRGVDDDVLAQELASGDQADNVSYINRVLVRRGLSRLAPDVANGASPLPNPMIWSLAAAAFAQLCCEWPMLANTSGTANRRAEIRGIGRAYQAAVQALAKDPELIPSLLDQYQKAVETYGLAMDQTLDGFQQRVLGGLIGRDPVDPRAGGPCQIFRGTDQDLHFKPTLAVMRGDNGAGELRAPADMYQRFPALFLLADWFTPDDKSSVSVRYRTAATATRHEHGGGHGDQHEVWWEVSIVLTVYTDFKGETVGAWTTQYTEIADADPRLGPGIQAFANAWIQAHWDNPPFDAQREAWAQGLSVVTATPTAAATAAATKVAADGLARSRRLFSQYLAEQSRAGLCDAAARRVDGLRYLIENIVRLLFSQPRSGDDIFHAIFDGVPVSDGGALLPGLDAFTEALSRLDPSAPPGTDPLRPMQTWASNQVSEVCQVTADRSEDWRQVVVAGQFRNPVTDIDTSLRRLATSGTVIEWEAILAAMPPA
jgi:hypothetical protein